MRSFFRTLGMVCFLSVAAAMFAQEPVPAPALPSAPAPTLAPASASTPVKADALELYRQGRSLEAAGKISEAQTRYRDAIAICDGELASDSSRMDAYTVKCWCLFRLERYREVVDVGTAGLKVRYDPRLSEVIGEAYFHLGNDNLALKNLQRYIENVGEYGDRVSTAYFYMGETYLRLKKYNHADIAYSLAVRREPSMARWWYRYGQTVESLEDYQRASDLYQRALRLSPEMKEASEALARVRSRATP